MADETVRVIADKEDIVAIADAVRSKTGSTDEMTLNGIVSGINSIETGGGGNVETCTVTWKLGAFSTAILYYDAGDGSVSQFDMLTATSAQMPKNQMVVIKTNTGMEGSLPSGTIFIYGRQISAVYIDGDITMMINPGVSMPGT